MLRQKYCCSVNIQLIKLTMYTLKAFCLIYKQCAKIIISKYISKVLFVYVNVFTSEPAGGSGIDFKIIPTLKLNLAVF
jgi:hypothetical protein